MPASTPRGYPYPLDTDPIHVARDIRLLAEAVDAKAFDQTTANGLYVNISGDTMAASSTLKLGTIAPTSTRDALSMGFADQFYLQIQGTGGAHPGTNGMHRDLDMNNNAIIDTDCGGNDFDPGAVGINQVITKGYANKNYLNAGGDTGDGTLTMERFVISDPDSPNGPNQATPKHYVDDNFLGAATPTVTNNLTVGGAPTGSTKGVRLHNEGIIVSNVSAAADGTNLVLRRASGADADGQAWVVFQRGDTNAQCGTIDKTNGANEVDYVGHLVAPSDYRLKEHLGPVLNAFDRVRYLAAHAYRGRWLESGVEAEVINAHDVADVAPYAVRGDKDGERMQGVDFASLIPLLVSALGGALQRIDRLERGVA